MKTFLKIGLDEAFEVFWWWFYSWWWGKK